MNNFTFRFFFNIGLLVSILFFPWWFTAVLALFGAFIFTNYIEVVMAGVLIDFLYGRHTSLFSFFSLYGTSCSIILYYLIKVLKSKLR